MRPTEKFVLDVGGKEFATTKDTLLMSPFLSRLLAYAPEDRQLFLDRDPDGFKHVLRKLRNPGYVMPDKWLSEWEFFCPPAPAEEPELPRRKEADGKEKRGAMMVDRLTPKQFRKLTLAIAAAPETFLPSKSSLKAACDARYLQAVVRLYPETCAANKSVFRLAKSHGYDRILYPLVDPEVVGEGVLLIGDYPIPFGKSGPFPSFDIVACDFRGVCISFDVRMEKLYLAVRIIKDPAIRRKKGTTEREVPGKALRYGQGVLLPMCDAFSSVNLMMENSPVIGSLENILGRSRPSGS